MTAPPVDNDFSYRLTESILSQTHFPQQQQQQQQRATTPSYVGPLPPNAIVTQSPDTDASFNNYIGNHFKQDAPVLLDRLSVPNKTPQKKESASTFWSYLSNDLDNGRATTAPTSEHNLINEKDNTWYEYDSNIFGPGAQHTYATATEFFSLGAFLFLLGFVFPPFWWIGSFYPIYVDERYQKRYDPNVKMVKRWRLLNRFFSLGFSTILIITIIVLAIVYATKY
ncbi:uncharacterized protein B0P05DRAFT_638530 [Gilbertella persicaria]|uniref:uncharacterized protein n=1 Tax=Gilbertella persicaria TaxID=101096 RepID=UPI00222025B5|nr:uncharacterized protein B0P05DRAFT_638530 [Gilbertella persicaria]KAI8075939.1 hypothetical protein B0P05DRAFT_638530 [Gilbertella persicaria]